MVQNLNNNLITAPELAELRKRLRNLETKVDIATAVSKSKLTILGWASLLRSIVSSLVSQCCRYVFSLPTGTSLRASIQPTANIVSRHDFVLHLRLTPSVLS